MMLIADIVSWVLLLSGSFFVLVGGVGLVRFPDFYTRIHAASITDTLGTGLIILGLLVQAGMSYTSLKLILIILTVFVTSPTAAHALAKGARHDHLPSAKSAE